MRKFLAIAFLLMMVVPALAESRVYTSSIGSGLPSRTYNGTQQITTSPTIIVDAAVYYVGVTVGDYVNLRDGGAGGIIVDQFYAPTANGYTAITNSGFVVDSGLYYTQGYSTGRMGLIATIKQ